MPLLFKHDLTDGVLALWSTEESLEELNLLCTIQEQDYAQRFTAAHRRREWLAWHALLHAVAPDAEPAYDLSGAPVLRDGYIGVSHTKGYAAIITGKYPCAVDIELPNRDFSKAASKFISPAETLLLNGENQTIGRIWCAKEALYKWVNLPEIDFIRDICIHTINPLERTLHGTIRTHHITLADFSTETLLMVCCIGPLNA